MAQSPVAALTTPLSLALLLAAWAGAAQITGDPQTLPTPWAVAQVLTSEATSGRLLFHMQATLSRVAAAFVLAMSIGTALGLALGLFARFDRWADPWVRVFLNIPALVVIVLCYLWIGLNELAAITAVAVNKTAMVAVTIREGTRARDPQLSEMATVFRMSAAARLRHVILPQLRPYVATSIQNGLAVIWKIVLVVEFLGRSNGVGFQIHLYFQLFDVAHVLAYALSFVAVMYALDILTLRLCLPATHRAKHRATPTGRPVSHP